MKRIKDKQTLRLDRSVVRVLHASRLAEVAAGLVASAGKDTLGFCGPSVSTVPHCQM